MSTANVHPAAHEASAWLRSAVTEALRAVVADPSTRTCRHVSPPRCLTLHDQTMRCDDCAVAYAATLRALDPAEDHTCDRCRTLVSTLTPLVIDLGALLVALGLCPACLAREGVPSHAAR